MVIRKLLSVSYLLIIFCLFLYSFTQVDLGLTLTRWPLWQETIQKFFQHIGYFNRPLSTILYISIIFLLFCFYALFIKRAKDREISRKELWGVIILTSIILTFSYNAFSYDLFNYVFDAKIVTFYHQNPYLQKALDYRGDPMLGFMHWTHRTYPYGPVWLALTIPLSYLGMKIFLVTLILFKLLAAVCFVGTTYYIGKILQKISPENELSGIVLFALNPLVIIESLVSAHIDIVMMFFVVFSFYLFIHKRYIFSFLIFCISVGIKFATIFAVPALILYWLTKRQKQNLDWERISLSLTLLMIIPVVLASIRTTYQPWYLLNVLPFAALVSRKFYIVIPSFIISLFSLFEYVPFLYLGNWDPPVPYYLTLITAASILLSFCIVGVRVIRSNFALKK